MIQRNKGDTSPIGLQVILQVDQATKYKNALIRILNRISVEDSDQAQQEDIKEIFKLLDYFSDKNDSK